MLFVGLSLKSFNIQLNIMLGRFNMETNIADDFNVNVLLHIKGSLDTQYFKNLIFPSIFFTS